MQEKTNIAGGERGVNENSVIRHFVEEHRYQAAQLVLCYTPQKISNLTPSPKKKKTYFETSNNKHKPPNTILKKTYTQTQIRTQIQIQTIHTLHYN
eukprot:m.136371 g.136371  ORF g.136371 m.136371 type:complete len:96 (-) comp10639_c0_seq1:1138-1425(-)